VLDRSESLGGVEGFVFGVEVVFGRVVDVQQDGVKLSVGGICIEALCGRDQKNRLGGARIWGLWRAPFHWGRGRRYANRSLPGKDR